MIKKRSCPTRISANLETAKGPFSPKTVLSSPGFSLLEVLVATALMGLVLVVLLRVLSTSIRAQEACRGQAQALMVGEQVLGEYASLRELKPGRYGGEEGRFAYQVSLEPQYNLTAPGSETRVTCYLIQVSVAWQERGKAKSLRLQTMRTAVHKKS
jgi:prepilin-type N-terminal cleavage/methylation domain-containing protein